MESVVVGSIGGLLVAFNIYKFLNEGEEERDEVSPYAIAPTEIPYDDEFGCFAPIQRKLCPIKHSSVPNNLLRSSLLSHIKLLSTHAVRKASRRTPFSWRGRVLVLNLGVTKITDILAGLTDVDVLIAQNQRCATVIVENCVRVKVILVDSAVVTSKTLRAVNCDDCEFLFEEVDVRKIELWNTTNSYVSYVYSPTITSNATAIWRDGCTKNSMQIVGNKLWANGTLTVETLKSFPVPDSTKTAHYLSYYNLAQDAISIAFRDEDGHVSKEALQRYLKLTPHVLRVLPGDLLVQPSVVTLCDAYKQLTEEGESEEKTKLLNAVFPSLDYFLNSWEAFKQTPFDLSTGVMNQAFDDERKEFLNTDAVLRERVKEVAKLVREARHCVIYTGAGISTSANIPDFRGPQGVWTLRDKGKYRNKAKGLNDARPTFAHYAITDLVRRGLIKFVVTTNMDSLHVRSGLPPHLIVEQHGNCHKEICTECGLEHYRQWNTLDSVISSREHFTFRYCKFCGGMLQDTIVHFSEDFHEVRSELFSVHHARKCDLALVLGTSMNVQPNASYPEQCFLNENGKMVIVNLQTTPYDHVAHVRLFCKTDEFMGMLIEELGIEEIDCSVDVKKTWDKQTPEETNAQMQAGIQSQFAKVEKRSGKKPFVAP